MKIKIGASEYAPRMPLIATIDGHLVGVVGAAIAAELLPASDRDRIGLPDLWSFPTVAAYGAAVVEQMERQKVATYAELCTSASAYFDALQSVTLTDDDAAAAENPT